MLQAIEKYLGWRNWSIIRYNSVIENIFLPLYISLRDARFSAAQVLDLVVFIVFSMLSTTYGYLINDLADRELDCLHGKENTFREDSGKKAIVVVSIVLLLSVAVGLYFADRPFVPLLWISWGCIATGYSLKPIRLKERGKIGLLFAVIAQRVLPTLLIFAVFRDPRWVDVGVFTLYIFFRGLSSDLNHQLEDHRNDALTETSTYAVTAGCERATRTFRFSLETEKGLLILCLVIMTVSVPTLEVGGMSLLLPILCLYLLLYGVSWRRAWAGDSTIALNPFAAGQKNIYQFLHHGFPSVVLPLYLLVLLTYQAWLFVPILVAFVGVRRLYSREVVRGSAPFQAIRNLIARCFTLLGKRDEGSRLAGWSRWP